MGVGHKTTQQERVGLRHYCELQMGLWDFAKFKIGAIKQTKTCQKNLDGKNY